jgi:DNA repair exonuclease SbcCD ATPase subunit
LSQLKEKTMRISQAFLPLVAALIIAGCGSRTTAENVVGQAEGALNSERDAAQTLAPEELKAAESTLAHMKQSLNDRKYKDVEADVPKFNQQVKAIQDAVTANQQAHNAAAQEWNALNAEVQKSLDAVQAQVDTLAKGKLPKGVTKQGFESAKTELEQVKTTWSEATAAAGAGKAAEATEKGRTVQAKVEALKTELGMNAQVASTAPAPAQG